MFKYKTFIQF